MSMQLKRLSREILYTGRIIDLWVDQVEDPSGKRSVREIAHHPGGAVVVPLLDDGRLILVEQLRYPLGKQILELPAGKLNPGEDPRRAAYRELEEETGWSAGRLDKLITFYTTPGFCDEELHIFIGTQLTPCPSGPRPDEGEHGMKVHLVPREEVRAMIARGEIRDGKTILGVLMMPEQAK
jgi:ADP-ribose pyrophosphatase